ncbi:MAG: Response regulator receiver domain [Blastocatellia bacterium]|jgi:CheY-like chemotaxis protein|nr:Response regulator receiver domain [Blastocatellia bacterium]
MIYVVCNENQQSFYRKLARAAGTGDLLVNYIFDRDGLREALLEGDPPGSILIDVSLTWDGKLLQNFYGLDVAAELRRVHAVKCPIIFFSPLKESGFEDYKYDMLRAPGSGLLSFPFSAETLKERLFGTEGLTETALRHVVIRHCGLREDWNARAHRIEKTLRGYPAQREETLRELSDWAASIVLYAPEQKRNLDNFGRLLTEPPAEADDGKLRDALQELDKGLLNCFVQNAERESATPAFSLPKAPPEYFSKILIADDEDLPDLVSSLTHDYHYDVEQARTPTLARQILDAKRSEVVLADWHFPERADGLAFIKYALKRKYPPLILVTSKAALRDNELREAGLPEDVINCTGPSDALNASTIHRKIWLGANRDNIFEPAAILPQAGDISVAQNCRERLERYAAIIDSHAGRWRNFARVLRYTHKTARLILPRASGDEAALIRRVIEILDPHLSTDEFSLDTIVGIVGRIEQEHENARRPPESETKGLLRGLLHGRIEQFSGIIGEIENIFEQLKEVAADLSSLPAHEGDAAAILDVLAEYRRGGYTRQQYARLGVALVAAYRTLPEAAKAQQRNTGGKTRRAGKVRLVVAEDDPHWQNIIRVAIAEVKTRLAAGGFVIEDLFFDNAAEAVKAVPRPRKEREIVSPLPTFKTIVISDICLPKDRAHADRINAAVAEENDAIAVPHRTHGLKLIRDLREFAYNIPVIVLSTVDAIEDRLIVGDWGVPDINYISKGVDDYRSVVQALIRLIEKNSKHRLEKIEVEDQLRFRIDGVDIKFTREEKNVFDAFFVICQRKEEMRRQRQQKYEPGVTVDQILEELRADASRENRQKIEKDFSSIRLRILESFQQARRYISTHEILKSTRRKDGTFVYQISAEIPTLEEQDVRTEAAEDLSSKREACKVLLVESDTRDRAEVSTLLRKLGYEIETADAGEAVAAAERFRPDILCLCVNAPADDADELRAVERIQTFLHDIHVAVPTTRYNDSRLLAKATQYGLSARDFVDKRRVNWLAWLAAVVGKQRRQILSGDFEETSFDARLPLVEVLDGSDLDKGIFKLRVNGKLFETKGARYVADEKDADVIHPVLGLLLQRPNEPVSEETVESFIGKEATKEMWKNWRKRMRDVIREWLEVKRADFKSKHDDPSHKILEYRDSHLTLHVNVIRSNQS